MQALLLLVGDIKVTRLIAVRNISVFGGQTNRVVESRGQAPGITQCPGSLDAWKRIRPGVHGQESLLIGSDVISE